MVLFFFLNFELELFLLLQGVQCCCLLAVIRSSSSWSLLKGATLRSGFQGSEERFRAAFSTGAAF